MKWLELKFPPPILFAVFAVTVWYCPMFFPAAQIAFPLAESLGYLSAVIGVLLLVAAARRFVLKKTSTDPMHPEKSSALIIAGVFRVSRNPMYLGLVLALLGISLSRGNALGYILVLFFAEYLTRFQIKPEERVLLEKFGSHYEDYCSRVRRWL